MMNKQLAFVKSGLGLALCFLMVGAGVTPPIHASNANVSISQQAKKVTGTVTDAKGEPLLGVNVVVKGTTNGTITDLDGKYSLEVEPNSILVVSYHWLCIPTNSGFGRSGKCDFERRYAKP